MARFPRRRGRRWDADEGWLAHLVAVLFPPFAEFERREREESARRAHEVRRRWAQVERRIADSRRGIEFDAWMAARAEEKARAATSEARADAVRHSDALARTAARHEASRRVAAAQSRETPAHVVAQQQARNQAAQVAAQRAAFFA